MLHNPNAFPLVKQSGSFCEGMSLRDWFAGQALAGLLGNVDAASLDGWSWRTGSLAGDAYQFADDMLNARKQNV